MLCFRRIRYGWHPTINHSSQPNGIMDYLCMLATSSLTNLGTPLLITFLCLCHRTCILNQDSMEVVLPFCTFENTTHLGWWFLVVNSFHATGFVSLNLECTALFNGWITQHYGVGGNAYWWMAFVIKKVLHRFNNISTTCVVDDPYFSYLNNNFANHGINVIFFVGCIDL